MHPQGSRGGGESNASSCLHWTWPDGKRGDEGRRLHGQHSDPARGRHHHLDRGIRPRLGAINGMLGLDTLNPKP